MNKLLLGTAACAVPVTLAALPSAPLDLERDAACVMPEDCLIYVEAPEFSQLCSQGLQHPLLGTILASPLGGLLQREVGMPAPFALDMLDLWAGRPVLPTLARLTEGGLAVGLVHSEGWIPVEVTLVARGDPAEWEDVLHYAMNRVAEEQGLPKDRVVPPHRRIRGMDVWLFGDYGALALRDGLCVLGTNETTLRRMLDLGAESGATGLAGRREFQQARSAYRAEDAFAWSWLDLEALEEALPSAMSTLRNLPGQPAAQVLLGASVANLGGARTGVAELRLDGDRIDLGVVGLGLAEGAAADLVAPTGGAAPTLPAGTGHEVARGMLHRDLAGLFRRRAELFSAQGQADLAEASSRLAPLLGGKSAAEVVLPRLDPWIGLIARPVEFDQRAVPDLPLPGAAVLLHTSEPEVLGPQLIAAAQSLRSMLNLKAALTREPVMAASEELHEGVVITYGRYGAPDEGEDVGLRYNLEPACAVTGETIVLGTHRGLVKELVTQLARGELTPTPGELLELSGPALARVIAADEEALARAAAQLTGGSEQQAREGLEQVRRLAEGLEVLRVETARSADGDLRVHLSLVVTSAR